MLGAVLTFVIAACGGDESAGLLFGGSAGAAGGSGGRGGSAGATGATGAGGRAGASGSGNGGSAGSGRMAGGAGGAAGGATDAGGAGSAFDASVQDTGGGIDGSSLDATADLSVPDSTPNDAGVVDVVSDSGCPVLVLGGQTEDVYVDKSVPQTGNGTKQCPFKTILDATSLAAPASTVRRRMIHVKGNNSAPDYVES